MIRRMRRTLSVAAVICCLGLGALSFTPTPALLAALDHGFPIGESRLVEFDVDVEALDVMSTREQFDQLRDWLLFTVVSSTGMSADEASQATFDLPAVRHDYLRPVARFEYGEVRSAFVGDGTVVALVPLGDPGAKADQLAHVADEHRKNLGESPRQIIPFEYRIVFDEEGGDQTAEVTRCAAVDAHTFFTPQAGYYEKRVGGIEDLKDFLARIDTITYASLKGGLTVGGRKQKCGPYLGVGLEDVAAIWQSEEYVKIREQQIAAYNRKLREFNLRWARVPYFTESEKEMLTAQREGEEAQLLAEGRQLAKRGSLANSSGFSLDPTYDFEGVKEYYDTRIRPMLLVLGVSDPSIARKVDRASEALADEDIEPLLDLLSESFKSGRPGSQAGMPTDQIGLGFLQVLDVLYGFQHARYDGKLQGTGVAMTLFYTDLLAKLWAFDYLESAPSRNIEDFRPVPEIEVSKVYEENNRKQPSTRLWFGPQDKGFQVADGGKSLLLARTAARVYAAGSNPLQPGKEGEPNIDTGTFLNWWDSHYDEIARYEPQYQRLNEIMKWSLIIGWLNKNNNGSAVSFLKGTDVYRGNWFPEWAQKQPDLRFKDWGEECALETNPSDTQALPRVCFYPPRHKGSETEALPLLVSRPFDREGVSHVLMGGVSLAGRGLFATRQALTPLTKITGLMRRSNLFYSSSRTAANTVRTLEGTSYRFSKIADGRSLVSATAREGAKMRSPFADLATRTNIKRVFSRTPSGGLSVETEAGAARVGTLDVAPSTNGFRVGYQSRTLERAQILARRLSSSSDAEAALVASPHVESYIPLPGKDSFAIRFKGSDQWVRMETGQASTRMGTTANVADLSAGARQYSVTWLKPAEVPLVIKPTSTLVVKTGTGGPTRIGIATRVPTGAEPFEGFIGDVAVRGYRNPATGEIFLARSGLPAPVFKNPAALGKDPTGGLSIEKGISKSVDLLRRGQYEETIAQVNGLIAAHGKTPELMTLRSLARLSSRSPQLAPHVKDALRGVSNNSQLFNEINARLAMSRSPGGIVPELLTDGRHVSLGFKTTSALERTRVVPSAINRRAIILVEDTPGLNNLNWNVNTLPTIQQAVELNIGQLSKVSRLKLGGFRPGQLIAPEVSTGASGARAVKYRVYYPRPLWVRGVCDDDDEHRKDRDDCEPDIYVVSAGKRR